MRSVHEYINSHHPGYIHKLGSLAIKKAAQIYSEYDIARRVLKDRQVMPAYRTPRRKMGGSGPYRSGTISGGRGVSSATPLNARRVARILNFQRRVARARNAGYTARSARRIAAQKRYRVATTGYFKGRLRKGRWKKFSSKVAKRLKYNIQGIEHVEERRGVQTDSQCVYVGHSIASYQLMLDVSRAIVRAIWKKAGIDVTDFNTAIPMSATNSYQLSFTYLKDVTSTGAWFGYPITITLGTTYNQLATSLHDSFVVLMTDAVPTVEGPWQHLKIYEFSLVNGVGTAYEQIMARIPATALNIDLAFTSKLTMQNQTLAAGGADVQDELTTNVENNPLKGKLYKSMKMSNGLTCKYKPNLSTTAFRNLIADSDTGMILESGGSLGNAMYYKPPDPYFFNSTKAVNVNLAPGAIKVDTIHFKRRMTIDRFFQVFGNAMWRRTNQTPPFNQTWVPFGLAHVVGFEKTLDSGASEANLRVAYELEQKYQVKLDYKNAPTVPYVVIS